MSLSLATIGVEGVTKTAVFESLTINQAADGRMSVNGRYRVDLRGSDSVALASLQYVHFSFTQEQLMENPNFPVTYLVIRELARTGLAFSNPELVTQ